jgi:hypothetical protein
LGSGFEEKADLKEEGSSQRITLEKFGEVWGSMIL